MLIGELVGAQTQRNPKLRLVQAAELQRKFKAARHHPDNGVGYAVEHDGDAEDARVAVVAVGPQCITDHCDRLTGIVFLRGKDTAEDRLNAERRKHFRIQACGIDLFWLWASRKLKRCRDIAAQRGKRLRRTCVRCDFASPDGHAWSASQVISKQNKPVRVLERKWAQQDAFDEREDRSGGANAQSQGEDDRECECRRSSQLAKCKLKILC